LPRKDNLTRLKAKVEVYEAEYQDAVRLVQNDKGIFSSAFAFRKYLETSERLLSAYREYTQELEKSHSSS
jgi:GrpB-like predicted nucleotidyltransferase (UPF0157 family)